MTTGLIRKDKSVFLFGLFAPSTAVFVLLGLTPCAPHVSQCCKPWRLQNCRLIVSGHTGLSLSPKSRSDSPRTRRTYQEFASAAASLRGRTSGLCLHSKKTERNAGECSDENISLSIFTHLRSATFNTVHREPASGSVCEAATGSHASRPAFVPGGTSPKGKSSLICHSRMQAP